MISNTYLVLPLSILMILIYLISLMLVKFGVIHKDTIRRIWNSLLLLTFIVTALLGLLIAIQVNYKIEWSFVERMLKWHVNFGIAMCFVAIIHLSWHLRYYLNLFKVITTTHSQAQVTSLPDLSVNKLKSLALLGGFMSIIIQVLLIREFATVFESNELMIGWSLGIWMLLTGGGAFLGRKSSPFNTNLLVVNILLVISILPLIIIYLIGLLKIQLFPPGMLVSPFYFLIIVFILFSPLCLLVGYSYALFIKAYDRSEDAFSTIYTIESIGSLFGGLVVSFLLIGWLTIYQSLFVLASFSLLFTYIVVKRNYLIVLSLIWVIILLISFIYPIDSYFHSKLFPNQKIVELKETKFGNLTVTESAGQYNFYNNGSLIFTTDNLVGNEEHVHFAMLQHKNPKRVLLVSGGISGMISEVLKYPSVLKVDYVELNPEIIRIGNLYKKIPVGPFIEVFSIDCRLFINNTNNKYDVGIFAIPDPGNIQVNRLYTNEFIRSVKSKLNKNAVIIYSLSSSGNYISDAKANITASVYNTLKNNFKNVEIIPGEKDYFVASDSVVNPGISELSDLNYMENKYVNRYYIDDFTLRQRGEFIKETIASNDIINTDDKPVPLFFEYQRYLAQFTSNSLLWILIPLIILIVPFLFFKNISRSVYVAGFASSSAELLVIFLFQLIFGYIYSAIGAIIAVFMGGLALGSIMGKRISAHHKYLFLSQILLGAIILSYPLIYRFINPQSSSLVAYIAFILMTLIPSTIVGFMYVTGTKLMQTSNSYSATINYSADLIGSAFGIVAITVFFLPVLGITRSCYVIAGLNFIIALLTLLSNRNIFSKAK